MIRMVVFAILWGNYLLSADTLSVDKNSAQIRWIGKKVTGEHDGSIDISSGWVIIDNNTIINGNIILDMKTITSLDIESPEYRKKLDDHLKNEDFFHVDSFPFSRLKFSENQSFIISDTTVNIFSAELTIRGITHKIHFPGLVSNTGDSYHTKGELNIDRTLFDVRYGSGKFFDDLGDRMIYDEFTIQFDMHLTKSEKN